MRSVLVFASLLVYALWCGAADFSDAAYSNGNRELFSLPRSSAMAGSDGVFAFDAMHSSNPAALASASGNSLSASYAGFYGNTFSTSALSYATSLTKKMGLGASASYLLVPHIPITSGWATNAEGYPIADSSLTRFANASEVQVRVAWGMRIAHWGWGALYGGAAVNALRRNLVGAVGYGIGADAGALVALPLPGINVGVVAENITTTYLDWIGSSYYDLAYPHVRVGLGFRKEIPYIYGTIQATYATLDLLSNEGANTLVSDTSFSQRIPGHIHPSEDPGAFLLGGRFGAEYCIADRVALRVGTSRINRVAFGAGVYFLKQAVAVDFAYLLHELAGTYQVSLGYRW